MKYWKRWAANVIEYVAELNNWTPEELVWAIECDITWDEIGKQIEQLRKMEKTLSDEAPPLSEDAEGGGS